MPLPVLDEPTLGLDILYRKQFYDSLLNNYFDRRRTIVVTTHQVEDVERVLTDLMFINRGCVVLDCSMEDFESRYLEVTVHPAHVAAARALKPSQERRNARSQHAVVRSEIRACRSPAPRARRATHGRPSIADLFLALLGDKPGNQAPMAQGVAQ
jgi:ABC-2 type transport system ATP-binding protein